MGPWPKLLLDYRTPMYVKVFSGFLRLTGYCTKFVKTYGMIAWTLTQQLKKDLEEDAQWVFDKPN